LKFDILRVPPIRISTKPSTHSSKIWLCVARKKKIVECQWICKMWQVYTRPTCASDFFIIFYFYWKRQIWWICGWQSSAVHAYVLAENFRLCDNWIDLQFQIKKFFLVLLHSQLNLSNNFFEMNSILNIFHQINRRKQWWNVSVFSLSDVFLLKEKKKTFSTLEMK
jgi:hypothetical protein